MTNDFNITKIFTIHFNKLLLDSPFIKSRFKNQILHKLMFETQEIVFKVLFVCLFFSPKKKSFVCFNIKGKLISLMYMVVFLKLLQKIILNF